VTTGQLSVDVKVLVDNATKRYEDALICDSLRYFLRFAGDVPAFAWGRMPWSSRWAGDWTSAVQCRVDEATTARDVQGETGAALAKVAANYAHTDIVCAVSFDDIAKENDFFAPWLTATSPQRSITVAPGSNPAAPDYYAGGAPKPAIPHTALTDLDDLKTRVCLAGLDHALGGTWMEAQGTVSDLDRALTDLGSTDGRRQLFAFVNQNSGYLEQAEKIIQSLGLVNGKLPMEGFINDAITAMPGIIANRAELINAVSAEWTERSGDMTASTVDLASFWNSPGGATAYFNHANRCIHYYDTLAAMAGWLGSEGKRAAAAIDQLQLAYARAGYATIDNLIAKLHAYLDAADAFTADLDKPAKALADAVSSMASMMLASWQEANADAATMLDIAQTAADSAPDLGDATHRAQPFPSESGTPGYDDAGAWQPGQGQPPGIAGA
jgi:hypothetical protein